MRKKSDVYFYFLIVIAIILVITSFFVWLKKPLEVEEIEVRFIVGGNPGFDLNDSALIFGKIPPKGSATRDVIITNDYDFPIRVKVFASENISDFLRASSNLRIDAGETLNIPVTVRIPEDLAFGNYSGKIRFEIHRK